MDEEKCGIEVGRLVVVVVVVLLGSCGRCNEKGRGRCSEKGVVVPYKWTSVVAIHEGSGRGYRSVGRCKSEW